MVQVVMTALMPVVWNLRAHQRILNLKSQMVHPHQGAMVREQQIPRTVQHKVLSYPKVHLSSTPAQLQQLQRPHRPHLQRQLLLVPELQEAFRGIHQVDQILEKVTRRLQMSTAMVVLRNPHPRILAAEATRQLKHLEQMDLRLPLLWIAQILKTKQPQAAICLPRLDLPLVR